MNTTIIEENNKKDYADFGSAIKNRDFLYVLENFLRYEKEHYEKTSEDLDILKSPENKNFSSLDELLYHLPRFATAKKTKQKKEAEDGIETSFLDDILLEDSLEISEEPREELLPYVLELVAFMLRNGANPNVPIKNGITPFMMACTVNNEELMKMMLNNTYEAYDYVTDVKTSRKADVNMGDGRGNRPFYYATMTQATYVMKSLVKEYGVNPDEQYFLASGQTVFHQVCNHLANKVVVEADGLNFKESENENKDKAINMLIELGADPTIMDDDEVVPEQRVPSKEDPIYVDYEVTPEEEKIWEDTYVKVANYRRAYEKNNTKKYKKNI